MANKNSSLSEKNQANSREDRLKGALKANLARRKAQMRARAENDVAKPKSSKDE